MAAIPEPLSPPALLSQRINWRTPGRLSGMALTLLACMLLGLSVGKYPVHLTQMIEVLAYQLGLLKSQPSDYENLCNVLFEIRLPRVMVAVLVGSALASAGTAYQAIFRNPLVSPSLLGVQSGAAVGAALGMLLETNWITVQLLAFVFGLLAVGLALLLGHLFGRQSLITLLLGGLISGALFAAVLAIIKFVADPFSVLPAIVYWMMGDLAQADLGRACLFMPPMLTAVLLLCLFGKVLDAMTLGDEEAHSLGIPVQWVRYSVILLATLLSAMTVSLAGIIGWIGIIIPHMVRLMWGPGNGLVLPGSALAGAAFLVLADVLSRIVTPSEIPIGIVTELLGIPAFILVLHRVRRGWN